MTRASTVPTFRAVLIEHGYGSVEYEREIIAAAGGEFLDADSLPLEETLTLCESAEAVMFRRLNITEDLVKRFRRCKIIIRYGVGIDNVDLAAATRAGIIVGHVPGYCIDEVSTHAIGLLLNCIRRITRTHQKMENGGWDVHRHEPVWRVMGRTLGIVGLGNIGQAVARKMGGWGLRLLGYDPFVDPDRAAKLGVQLVALDTLCGESDYITLHCPLLPETRHLIGAAQFGAMQKGAIIVNTARGPAIDTAALLNALARGQIEQAALDVFEGEPLPRNSPLLAHPQVIITDHMAWYSEESQIQLQRETAKEVVRVCTGGLPQSLANPEVLVNLGRYDEWIPSESARWQLKRLGKIPPPPRP